ncbi:MAG: AraC family ligand binding domain-containing protein [Lachnospiraceae bacterium]
MKNSLKSEFTRRQQMIREDFELYYYSDTYLEPVQPHSHSCYEIYFFLEGKVRMQAGDEGAELLSGDFLVIPPDTVHFPRFGGWEKPYRRVILWVSQSFWEELQEKSKLLRRPEASGQAKVCSGFPVTRWRREGFRTGCLN